MAKVGPTPNENSFQDSSSESSSVVQINDEDDDDTSFRVPPSIDRVLPIPGILPGLEYLVGLYHIFIKASSTDPKADEAPHAISNAASVNYEVLNISGRRLFLATETSSNRNRIILRENRPFEVKVYDNQNQLVLKIIRPFTCELMYWGGICCGNILSVHHGNGQLLGTIKQKRNPFAPTFKVYDSEDKILFLIRGPRCLYYRCLLRQFDFYLFEHPNIKKTTIGRITKEWGGRNPKMFSQVDTGIEFPVGLDPVKKILLLGAVFMLEFQFIEPHQRNPKWNSQSCTGNKMLLSAIFILGALFTFYYFAVESKY